MSEAIENRLPLILNLLGAFIVLIVTPVVSGIVSQTSLNPWLKMLCSGGCFVLGGYVCVIASRFEKKVNAREDKKIKRKKAIDEAVEKHRQEEDYLSWCDEQTDEERYLQHLADGLLNIYDWDGMPRIKARLNSGIEDKSDRVAHYNHGFGHWRKRGHQAIEFKPSYFYRQKDNVKEMSRCMKHELVHAWIDWRGIKMDDPHGSEFQCKLEEVS